MDLCFREGILQSQEQCSTKEKEVKVTDSESIREEGMDGHVRFKGRESSGAKEGNNAILQPVPRPKDLQQMDLFTLSVSR